MPDEEEIRQPDQPVEPKLVEQEFEQGAEVEVQDSWELARGVPRPGPRPSGSTTTSEPVNKAADTFTEAEQRQSAEVRERGLESGRQGTPPASSSDGDSEGGGTEKG